MDGNASPALKYPLLVIEGKRIRAVISPSEAILMSLQSFWWRKSRDMRRLRQDRTLNLSSNGMRWEET